VLRGEDLLSSTPRQIPIYQTLQRLGVGNGPPRFGHLPMVMGEGNRKLSKRDPGSGLLDYVDRGFLPEGLLNYLALLGWGIAEDRDVFTMQEMAEAFDIRRVNPSPARFDMKKLEAINSAHMRRISLPDMTERVIPFLAEAELVDEPIGHEQRTLLDAAMPLVHERINTLSEAVPMLGFLFVVEDAFTRTDEIDEAGHAVVKASYDALSGLDDWSTAAIEASLREALVEGMGLKPRNAFGPVRVAVTGSRVSPPLFESLELLGRERSLGRLQAALA
jgi:glutamyl-tRNA synthetase